MKNKSKKILSTFLILIIVFSTNAYAKSSISTEINTNDWKPSLITQGSNTKLIDITNKVLGTIQTIGSVFSVIVLILIGIKYMIVSIEEKAKYKETMMPYIIGCVLVFSISNIASIIYNIAINIT